MDIATKLLVAEQLAKLGVDIIEAGFAANSDGESEAISKIAQTIRGGPRICSLARTKKEDIETAAKSLEKSFKSRIHLFVATSAVHMEKKLRKSPREILDMVFTNVQFARKYTEDVEFSPEDAGRTGIDFLKQVVSVAIDAGATTINIPDTVGYLVGDEYAKIISVVKELLVRKNSLAVISVHCHNDLGLAVANTLAGVQAGARQIECCMLGIGERAGNAQLEAVVMALKTRQDYFGVTTGVDTKKLYETSHIVSSVIGKPIPDNLPVVGGSAFAHGAGIHSDGMNKARETYEIMKPEDVGWRGEASPLVKHSGRTALKKRLGALGYDANDEVINKVWPKFKLLADQKTYVYNEDLHLLMQEYFVEQMAKKEKLIKVERVDYHRINDAKSAVITLSQNGKIFVGAGNGDGPVASIGDAIRRALKISDFPIDNIIWEGYNVSQSMGGVESIGLVNIRAKNSKGSIGFGRASDTDIIFASAKAMISAINHLRQTPVQKNNGNGD